MLVITYTLLFRDSIFFKEMNILMNTFINEGCSKQIKCDSKNFYIDIYNFCKSDIYFQKNLFNM